MATTERTSPTTNGIEPLKAYMLSQPRRVRFFSKQLEVVWSNRPGDGHDELTFAQGESIPPKGRERDRWPVSLALKGIPSASRLYSSSNGNGSGKKWKVTAWPLRTEHGLLAVEETEVTEFAEDTRTQVKQLDQDIEDLLHNIFEFLQKGTVDGPLRLSNPHLANCVEQRVCTNRNCPAYNNPTAERCWEVTAFNAMGSNGEPDILSKFDRCSDCQVFDLASPDSFSRITENFNRLIALLQLKFQETLDVLHRMQQADKLAVMGQLLAGIAHEIKNPLGIIIGRLDVIGLELETLDQEGLPEDIATIQQQANRIRNIIDSLLDTARPEPPKFAPIHINSVIMDTLKMVRKTLMEKRIRTTVDLQQDLPRVPADQIQMQQVLLNLILNARDAMADDGHLTIATRIVNKTADGVEITVTDDGEGIPPDLLRRLFSSFQTTKLNKGGTGLGLAVCHRIMEVHNGTISAESTLNAGTTMRLWLPLKGNRV